ncbi:MAG: hypothetical protein ABII02_02120 [Candidatus Magasanikbacteria bacterium]
MRSVAESALGGRTEGTNYLFTNQEYDWESELYYYNARYYQGTLIPTTRSEIGTIQG